MKKEIQKHRGAMPSLISSSGFPANKYTVARHTGEPLRRTKVQDIRDILDICALLAGFGRDITEEEMNVLVSQLVQNKGYFKPAEIKTAFDCAFNGELDIKPEDLKPYNQFSWLYLSRILTAYEKKVQQGRLIQELSLPVEQPETTREDIINGKKGIMSVIIEKFHEGAENAPPLLDDIHTRMINDIYKFLESLGYKLGEPKELRELYVAERNKELHRSEYWRKQKQKAAFAEYRDKNFMNKHKEAMNKNKVHRTVAKRCRMLSVQKFYDEQKEFEVDLVQDIQERFNDWETKFKAS